MQGRQMTWVPDHELMWLLAQTSQLGRLLVELREQVRQEVMRLEHKVQVLEVESRKYWLRSSQTQVPRFSL